MIYLLADRAVVADAAEIEPCGGCARAVASPVGRQLADALDGPVTLLCGPCFDAAERGAS
jgi:hypothetical protein